MFKKPRIVYNWITYTPSRAAQRRTGVKPGCLCIWSMYDKNGKLLATSGLQGCETKYECDLQIRSMVAAVRGESLILLSSVFRQIGPGRKPVLAS